MSAEALRNLTLAVPLCVVCVTIAVRRPRLSSRAGVAACLGFLYAVGGVYAVEAATSWWSYLPGPTTFQGVPLETVLGWGLLWGALPVLAGGHPTMWLLGFAWVDAVTIPHLAPLVTLTDRWWIGEAVLLATVALPALWLGRWTVTGTQLYGRVVVQMAGFSVLGLWLLPTVVLSQGGTGWPGITALPFAVRAALLVVAVAVTVPGLAAVAELARVGRGTPFPWDPPEQLVTTGPYAYLANPMQASATGLLTLLALACGSWWLLGLSVGALAFCLAVANPHEDGALPRRWPAYSSYRRHVGRWWPRWRPWVPAPAALWAAGECGVCSGIGAAIARQRPVGLVVRPAEEAGRRLVRLRWADAEGETDRGVAALARALEHLNLAWAWLGWLLRLPMVNTAVQAVADATGLGPRELSPRS